MNRRDVVKGAAMLALSGMAAAQGVSICNSGASCTLSSNSLLVWLEGPFAVVLQRKGSIISAVIAFSPVHQQHSTAINGVPLPKHPQQHHYHLPDDPKLMHPLPTVACLAPDFKDFCSDNLGLNCDFSDSFVSLVLPCPKNIYTRKLRRGITSSGDPVCIPQDHVLEFELTAANQAPPLVYEQTGQIVQPFLNMFHIEIGLDHVDLGGVHAMVFHNQTLLKCFPQLQADPKKQLMAIDDTLICPLQKLLPELVTSRLNMFTSTLECKSGGIIGGNP
jgi:hypothetical protein